MQPGVYRDISNGEYHRGPGVSKSGLDLINQSPAHFFGNYLDPNRPQAPEQTASQLVGELAHCAVLEPDQFGKRFVVGPDVKRNTKVWKEFEQGLPAGLAGIKQDQYDMAWRQADSLRRLPQVREALERGFAEASAFWIDPVTGVLCKCRPDWAHECDDSGVILLDVKTCGDASPQLFRRDIARMRYHVQDAYYSDGFALASRRVVHGFIFAAVECEYPYVATAMMVDEPGREQGRRDYRRNLNTYAECLKSGQWPGYSDAIELVSLPAWAITD